MKVLLYLILVIFSFMSLASANEISLDENSQMLTLQQFRSNSKLYVPHFVLIGEDATFKVFTSPNKIVKLVLDYGYSIDKCIFETKANEKGIAVFSVPIINSKDFVGKSVGVDAYIIDENNTSDVKKAVMLNDRGGITNSNRIDITDSESAKGFMFAPWQAVNEFVMNVNYDEKSGFDPLTDRVYDNKTPVYVRNMRDAQENVKEIPTNFSSSNR